MFKAILWGRDSYYCHLIDEESADTKQLAEGQTNSERWRAGTQAVWLQNHHVKSLPRIAQIKTRASWSLEEWERKIWHSCIEIVLSSRTVLPPSEMLNLRLKNERKRNRTWLSPKKNHHLGSNFDIYKNYFKRSRLLQYRMVFLEMKFPRELRACSTPRLPLEHYIFHLLFWPLW